MLPIAPLMIEHRLIERMVKLMAAQVETIDRESQANWRFVESAVDLIRTYADRCHHGKEEDILFKELSGRPMDPVHARTMGELLQEHVEARNITGNLNLANEMYAAGETGALGEVRRWMSRLVEFYPVHIEKEDRHFFIPVMELFSGPERDAMLRTFYEFDRKIIHERYRSVVQKFEAAGK